MTIEIGLVPQAGGNREDWDTFIRTSNLGSSYIGEEETCISITNYYSGVQPSLKNIGNTLYIYNDDVEELEELEIALSRKGCFKLAEMFLRVANEERYWS